MRNRGLFFGIIGTLTVAASAVNVKSLQTNLSLTTINDDFTIEIMPLNDLIKEFTKSQEMPLSSRYDIIMNIEIDFDALLYSVKDVIDEKSTLVHDADKSHEKLIKTLNLKEELNKSYLHDKQTQENMLMINSLCSWIKRFIYRYAGMKTKNLQRYLNWFVYLFRVKQANEKWPKNERILHHLLLDDSKFVGLYKKKKTI